MTLADISIKVEMPRRRAVASLYKSTANKLGLGPEGGDYECFVLFATQEADEQGCTPVFVCEFLNGRVGNVYTERVSFIDTDDKGDIVDDRD